MARLKLPRLSSRTRDTARTILDLTLRALETGKDTIVAAAPVPGLGVALDVLIALLEKVQAADVNRKSLQSLVEATNALAKTLEGLALSIRAGLEEYPDSAQESTRLKHAVFGMTALLKRLNRLESELRAVCDSADKLNRRSSFGRVLHSSSDAEAMDDMKEKIIQAHQRFQIEGGVATEKMVIDTMSDLKKVMAAQKFEEEELVLRSMPRTDEAHFLSAANATKARFYKDTRTRLFEDLDKWVAGQTSDPRAPPVCVLVGEAGTGKSTVASEFSRRLRERDLLGASFFFTRGVQELNSPKKFFSTVASQLARSQSALRVPMVNAAREHMQSAALQQLQYEFADLLEKPLDALPLSHPPIFVIVDALDECTDQGPELIPLLLRLLLSYASKPGSPLRVFLTSRPEPHYIHEVFTAMDFQPRMTTINIQHFRRSVDQDIEAVIRARLSEHNSSQAWSDADSSIVTTLVRKSDGLFVYARTAVDFILGDLSDLSSRYTDLIAVEKTVWLTDLDELYRIVLRNVIPSQDRHYSKPHERLKRILGYLVVLQGPDGLSPRTLERLTGMAIAESISVLNRLRSVVFFEHDNPDSPFRIIHATFREFLSDPKRSGDLFPRDVGQIHGSLARDCMRTILSFRTAQWPNSDGAAFLLRLSENRAEPDPHDKFPHVCYAQEHLIHHCEHSDSPQHLRDELKQADTHVPHSFYVVCYWFSAASSRTTAANFMWTMISDVIRNDLRSACESSRLVLEALLSFSDICKRSPNGNKASIPPPVLYRQLPQVACLCIMLDIESIRSPPQIYDAVYYLKKPADTEMFWSRRQRVMYWINNMRLIARQLSDEIFKIRPTQTFAEVTSLLYEAHEQYHRAIEAKGLATRDHRLRYKLSRIPGEALPESCIAEEEGY